MRMTPVEEAKSIDQDNKEDDICPFSMSADSGSPRACITSRCMAWFWVSVGECTGVCALVYKPETLNDKGEENEIN